MRNYLVLATMAATSLPAFAEIEILEGAADAIFAYQHPSLRSLVFATEESRNMAILPPAPVFVMTPPLLWRVPTVMPPYPPPAPVTGFNQSARPGNADMANYALQRSHAFSQRAYYRENYPAAAVFNPAITWYGYGGYTYAYSPYGPAYPPVPVTPGFNQGNHPSNRDNAIYSLDRAHRFSMGGYKQR